jgi:CheY-like chemotaxis protein
MNRRTLLYVDDSSDDLFLFQKACSQASVSFHLRSLSSGREAMEYLEGAKQYSNRSSFPIPDLVLLDLKMPVPNGFEVLGWIRGHAELKGLPVCVLTSSFQTEDVQKAYALGANCFLTKPVSLQSLGNMATALDKALSRTPPQFDCLANIPEFRK